MRKGALQANKEGLTWDVKAERSLGCSDHESQDLRILSEQGKKQEHSAGLQESRLWPLQRSACKSPMEKGPAVQKDPRRLVNIQGSPPPSSRALLPTKQEVRQKCQEAYMDDFQ